MSEVGPQPSGRAGAPARRVDGATIVLVAISAVWLVFAAFLAVPQTFLIDGFIYHAMVDALAQHGSFEIVNGYDTYRDVHLAPHLTQVVDGRIVSQYPVGWGLLSLPAYEIAGLRGVIVLSALAGVATLWLVRDLGRTLFDARTGALAALLYGLCSPAVVYVIAVWPHAIATLTATVAVVAAARGHRAGAGAGAGAGGEGRWTLLAGLALGFGVSFRVDVFFLFPALWIWILGAGARPWRSAAFLVLGSLPGLAFSSWANWMRFGTLSPISYGNVGGGTSVSTYADVMPLAGLVLVLSLLIGHPRVRAVLFRAPVILGLAGAFLALAVLIDPFGGAFGRIAWGFWVLGADFQSYPVDGAGHVRDADGVLLFYGLLKKALFESMPFAVLSLVLLPALLRGSERPAIALCLLVLIVPAVPYAFLSWHGNYSFNMRYFLHGVPALMVLSAAAFLRMRDAAAAESRVLPILALAVVLVAGGLWPLFETKSVLVMLVRLHDAVALVIVALALGFLVLPATLRGAVARSAAAVFMIGCLLGFGASWVQDLRYDQQVRSERAEVGKRLGELAPDAVIITRIAENTPMRLNRPPALTVQAPRHHGELPPTFLDLVGTLMAEGRPVYAQGADLAAQLLEAGVVADARPLLGLDAVREVYSLVPPG